MRLSFFALAAAAAALAAAGPRSAHALPVWYNEPAFPHKTNATTVKVTNQLVATATLQQVVNLPGLMGNGSFVVDGLKKPTEKVEVTDVGCLETVIPPPLNWGPLWCAGREAHVYQWFDEAGSMHRHIDVPVQQNVTADMVLWLFSPLFPTYVEFAGKMWFWYHLWHPLDHIMASNAAAASTSYLGKPGLYTLIHEHYRNPKDQQGMTEYETDAWFTVEDFYSNYIKKRIVISINTVGIQAWTLIVNLKDTPAGLKIDNELILGVAAHKHDPTDPAKGYPPEAAALLNDNLINPMLHSYVPGNEFYRSTNAITRHVIEEFSMFRFFLPQVWERFPYIHKLASTLGFVNQFVPKLNYGPLMFKPPTNTAGLTEALAPLNRTALHNATQLREAVGKVPAAVAAGASININTTVAKIARDATQIISLRSPTVNLQIKIPSAAGAFPPAPAPAPVPAAAASALPAPAAAAVAAATA